MGLKGTFGDKCICVRGSTEDADVEEIAHSLLETLLKVSSLWLTIIGVL